MLFGAIVRCAYESFYAHRHTPAVVALYTIFVWQAVWIFYESIKNITSMTIAIMFFLSSFLIASLVRPRQKGSSSLVA